MLIHQFIKYREKKYMIKKICVCVCVMKEYECHMYAAALRA